jgi:two-component system sensor histidine kinase KdpD
MVLERIRPYAMVIMLTGAATLSAWLTRGVFTLANFTALYILLVILVAVWEGTTPALLAAFLSFLCFNFFLIAPLYTFLVYDTRQLLDLIVFLVVALISGQLSARIRQQAQDASERAYEQEVLYKLTRAFNQLSTTEGVHKALIEFLYEDLKARQAYIVPMQTVPAVPNGTLSYLLLQADTQVYGTLCVAFDSALSPLQTRLLNTAALLAAMAIHRIHLEERARKSQQFEEADRLKTAILHAVSHDLRTPITIIKTSASNLRHFHEGLSEDDRRELAETIENEADELNRLVGNLLDMSRLNAGAFQLNWELNSLEEVIGDIASRVWQLTKQERIQIHFPDDMPFIRFDYGLMLQAFSNLVDNALRYEPPDRQIEIRAHIADHHACVKIINHGPNVTPQEREHLMEPFFRGRDGHIGLGLPIAKGIIEAHHGRLWLEDTPGGGATFVVALPFEPKGEKHETPNPGGG